MYFCLLSWQGTRNQNLSCLSYKLKRSVKNLYFEVITSASKELALCSVRWDSGSDEARGRRFLAYLLSQVTDVFCFFVFPFFCCFLIWSYLFFRFYLILIVCVFLMLSDCLLCFFLCVVVFVASRSTFCMFCGFKCCLDSIKHCRPRRLGWI